jgi:outer membrane protein OmpA-like peptidoglycan-associated protein
MSAVARRRHGRLVSRALGGGAAFAALLTLATGASAQQASGFAIDHMNPSERGSDWFSEDSLDLRGGPRFAIGALADYARDPLVIVGSNGSTVAAPVRDQAILHVGASLVLIDRLRFALDLPVGFADGTAGAVGQVKFAAAGTGIGDLRLAGDVRVLGKYGDPLTVAAGVALFAPTGNQAAYMSDGTARALLRVAAAGDVGPMTYAAHLGFEVRPTSDEFPDYPTGSELQLGGAIGLRLASRRLVLGPEINASTVVTNSTAIFSTRQTPVEGLLGVHYAFADAWRVGAGVGTGLTRGFGEPTVRGTVMLEWAMPYVAPLTDRDHDFIPDNVDACPDLAGVKTNDPRTNGCPLTDRDHDGVPDVLDACPDVPGVKTDDPRTNGCPPDRDHDGVPDSEDACPDVPGVKMDNKATNGCMPDSDHDGIPDGEDACPDVPGVKTDDPKTNGCPDVDHDQDGIPNAEDACPDVKGPRDPDPKRNGCPAAYVQDDMIKTLDGIHFSKAGALLYTEPETKAGLDALLSFLEHHPEIKHVRIEGHTDNQGDANANRALSAKKAAALVDWLVKRRIAPDRVRSMGVGGDSPIADNTTEAGRKANDRLEIHVE